MYYKGNKKQLKKDVIFFWIPKNAGSSIYKILKKNGCRKIRYKYKNFENEGLITFGHIDINYLLKKDFVEEEFFNNAFKFCFVRNPWDRTISLYHYLKYDKEMTFEEFVYFLETKFKLRKTFRGKIFKLINKGPDKLFRISKKILNRFGIWVPTPRVYKYNARGISQTNPQTDWILDNKGDIMVDFIGRVENIEEDLKKCLNLIGIEENEIPHINKTDRKKYREYYNKKTKNIIRNIYQKDIELFDYEF